MHTTQATAGFAAWAFKSVEERSEHERMHMQAEAEAAASRRMVKVGDEEEKGEGAEKTTQWDRD